MLSLRTLGLARQTVVFPALRSVSLHGCFGSSLYIVVLLLTGFAGGLFCGAGLVLCFCLRWTWARWSGWSTSRKQVLSPAVDSEDSFDSRFVQYHRPDVRFLERPVLDSHPRRRHAPRAPPSPAGDGVSVAQREARFYSDDDDACWLPLIQLSPDVIVRAVLGAQETEETYREAAATTTALVGETLGLSELGPSTAPLSAPLDPTPGRASVECAEE